MAELNPQTRIRLSWIHVTEDKQMLFLYTPKKVVLLEPGGWYRTKTPTAPYDKQKKLAAKIYRDLGIRLNIETTELITSFAAQIHKKKNPQDDVSFETYCYRGDFLGKIEPKRGYGWCLLNSKDFHLTSESGKGVLQAMKQIGFVR